MENGKIIGFEIKPKFCVVTYTTNDVEQGEPTPKEHTTKVHREPSEQLRIALRSLVAHSIFYAGFDSGLLGEKEFKNRKIVDMPVFSSYRFKSFKISGNGDNEKVKIDFVKHGKNESEAPVAGPKIPFAEGVYIYDEILAQDLDMVLEEVGKFIKGKNYHVQTKLELEPAPKEDSDVDDI